MLVVWSADLWVAYSEWLTSLYQLILINIVFSVFKIKSRMARPNLSWLARFIDTIWREGSDLLSNKLLIHTCRWRWSPRCDFSSGWPHWKVEGPWCLSGGAPMWPHHHPIRQPPLFQQLPKDMLLQWLKQSYNVCTTVLYPFLPHRFPSLHNLVTVKDQGL